VRLNKRQDGKLLFGKGCSFSTLKKHLEPEKFDDKFQYFSQEQRQMKPQPLRRDILGEVLVASEKPVPQPGQHDELEVLLSLFEPPKKIQQERNRLAEKRKRKKKKITTYFSQEVLETLDRVRGELKLHFPDTEKNTFCRSNILEKTVILMLKEIALKKTHKGLLDELSIGRRK